MLCLLDMKYSIKDLREKLSGDIKTDAKTKEYFSTDGSIFTLTPKLVIYPENELDVIESVRYFHYMAKDGKTVPLTSRGKGTDQGGAALSEGAVMVFPAHMKHLVHMGRETVTVQPGMLYSNLQTMLHSHGRFLPPYPASIDFASIGGAVANNSAGEKTVKYGSTRDYVKALRVVLSNGDAIETYRLNKKELAQKKKQQDFEGELYRKLDDMIEQNWDLVAKSKPHTSKNSAGYDLWDVKRADGSFDLSQLICGSQGTLGVVTEITLYHTAFNPKTTLLVGFFDSLEKMTQATQAIMPLGPSALEIVDHNVLKFVRDHNPSMIQGIVPETLPAAALLIEFDDFKLKDQDKKTKRARKVLEELCYESKVATSKYEQDKLWKMRRRAAAYMWTNDSPKRNLPIIEDATVPVADMPAFLKEVYALLDKYKVAEAMWGHAGNANFHIQPLLDLGSIRDRQKIYSLMNEFYKLVVKYHGSTCAEHNDGIIRAPYLKAMFGAETYKLFEEVKKMFDPYNFLNPTSKIGPSQEFGMVHMRKEYSMPHLADHMPGLGAFH